MIKNSKIITFTKILTINKLSKYCLLQPNNDQFCERLLSQRYIITKPFQTHLYTRDNVRDGWKGSLNQ